MKCLNVKWPCVVLVSELNEAWLLNNNTGLDWARECRSHGRVFEWHDFVKVERMSRMMNIVDVHIHQKSMRMFRKSDIVWNDRRLSIRTITEMVSIIKETVRQNLNMAEVDSKVLTSDKQKIASEFEWTFWNKLKWTQMFWKRRLTALLWSVEDQNVAV